MKLDSLFSAVERLELVSAALVELYYSLLQVVEVLAREVEVLGLMKVVSS